MTYPKTITETLMDISEEKREMLLNIEKKDKKQFHEILTKLIRLKRIKESGNKKAWEEIKKEEEKTIEDMIKTI